VVDDSQRELDLVPLDLVPHVVLCPQGGVGAAQQDGHGHDLPAGLRPRRVST
jgi:hypothetical protein